MCLCVLVVGDHHRGRDWGGRGSRTAVKQVSAPGIPLLGWGAALSAALETPKYRKQLLSYARLLRPQVAANPCSLYGSNKRGESKLRHVPHHFTALFNLAASFQQLCSFRDTRIRSDYCLHPPSPPPPPARAFLLAQLLFVFSHFGDWQCL